MSGSNKRFSHRLRWCCCLLQVTQPPSLDVIIFNWFSINPVFLLLHFVSWYIYLAWMFLKRCSNCQSFLWNETLKLIGALQKDTDIHSYPNNMFKQWLTQSDLGSIWIYHFWTLRQILDPRIFIVFWFHWCTSLTGFRMPPSV